MPNASDTVTAPGASRGFLHRLKGAVEHGLFKPIDLAPLVYFRVLFGAIMLWEVTRYLHHDWVERYYIDPDFFFTYFGFGWVQPWPGNYMYVHFLALGILAVFIMLGLWYRLSATLFFLGFTYVFLLDQTNYLNHFYLISLISLLMIFVPAHRAASLDVIRHPELQAATGPAWPLWLLRAQIAVAYFFGGVAKLNGDWLRGEPMRTWLAAQTDFPVIGRFFTEAWAPYLFSYGGLLLDLLIVPLLLWRRTRLAAFLLVLAFHLTNAHLFSIGIFPWFMIGATALFFEPERFRRFRHQVEKRFGETRPGQRHLAPSDRRKQVVLALFTAYMGLQILFPLRHWLYPGNVNWTEEGHNFSWHMKLRDKEGSLKLTATDPQTGKTWTVNQRQYLSSRQRSKMKGRPDMIVLFCHYLEEQLRKEGHREIEVRAEAMISLNGRAPQLLIDPTVDLTRVQRSLRRYSWILPLDTPLPVAGQGP